MNFSSPKQQDETNIELTPLIDVVFLLLIFFMITTTFNKETKLKINLPDATVEPSESIVAKIEVQVDANSNYSINVDKQGKASRLTNSNRQTLKTALSSLDYNENSLLVIRADRKATHEAVIRVLDVAQELGLNNVSFATKKAN